MSLNISNLKESNAFLSVLFDNLTSAIFLADTDYKVKTVNHSFEILFNKRNEAAIGQLCGDVLGCYYTIAEKSKCGTTSHCNTCELRASIRDTFLSKNDQSRKQLSREFLIDSIKTLKHLQYSTRYIKFDNNEMIVLIVDDITDIINQKNELKEKNREIIASLRYAKKIQSSLLPCEDVLATTVSESFTIFMPKDIVSGDFYWVYKTNDYLYCAVADCTGHGVPGAFMSLLGISFLNQILSEMGTVAPSLILDRLRILIVDVFKQQGNEIKDGMDVILIALNTKTLKCQYSGANNSLYFVRHLSSEFEELLPDKMPIGLYENMSPFTNKTIQLAKGDILYLRTDGFEDQFGGPQDKKFLSGHLKDLLLNICKKTMVEQKEILLTTFDKWKDDSFQIDDVTLLGLKV